MVSRAARRRGRRSRLRLAGLIALGVVAVITAVLVVIATRPVPPPTGVEAKPIPGYDDYAEAGNAPARVRVLAPGSDDVAWRGTLSGCSDDIPVELERSDDGGDTWASYSLDSQDAAALVDVAASDGGDYVVAIVREAADCTLSARVSMTAGSFWSTEEPPAEVSYYATQAIVTGTAQLPLPCTDPLDFEQRTATDALVLCDRGLVQQTRDGGDSWEPLAVTGEALATTRIDAGYLLALVGSGECDGIRVMAVEAAGSGSEALEAVACLESFTEEVPVALGTSASGDVWAWMGDRVAVIGDGGMSWPGSWRRAPEPTPTPTPVPVEVGEPVEPGDEPGVSSEPSAEPVA